MGTVNKKLQSEIHTPGWAAFLTPSQYADFTRLITDDLQARGLSWKEDDSAAVVRRGGGKAQRVGLMNIAQICRGEPLASWPKLLREYFDSVLKIDQEIEHLLDGLANLDSVRERIKLRLHGEEYRKTPGADQLLLRPVAEGLLTMVVCDLGSANISVPRDMMESWGLTEDEVFSLGLANVRRKEKVTHTTMPPLPSGVVLEGLESGSNYAATHLLCLEEHLKGISGYGAIVAAPNRHILFLHRIMDERYVQAMSDVHTMAQAAYKDGPGSISKELYWWRKDRGLRRLPTVREDNRLAVLADPEFFREVIQPMQSGN